MLLVSSKVVGRLASRISTILMGKHKPVFLPHKDNGDFVVVINAADVKFTGNKFKQKLYRWHTGYPGGLKEVSVKMMHQKKPNELLRRAVWGMLPKNKLRKVRARKLQVL